MNSEGTRTHPSEQLSRIRPLEFIDMHPSLPHWKDILARWIHINRDLYDITNGTLAPYSYRERPNVSALAAAAVAEGWIALEECWLRKSSNVSAHCYGRADVTLWKGRRTSIVEATFTRDSIQSLKAKIRIRSDRSRKQAERCLANEASEHIAVTFVVPRVVPGTIVDRRHLRELFDKTVEECRSVSKNWERMMMAGVFLGEVECLSADRNDEDMAAVGVVILGEAVKCAD
jgi:hypothetical protein